MDTPAGRIDEINTKKTIDWMLNLTTGTEQQGILMVHSGELNDETLANLDIDVAHIYRITKVEKLLSKIEKVK